MKDEQIKILHPEKPLAESRRPSREALSAEELIARYKNAPQVDYAKMREELDAIIDQSL